MGISLMKNFEQPYFATSVADFWRRWHISLTSWFRDYIYFPLGGSRCSKIKHYRNIMIVFLMK
jgi:D-alanyl-lipoteichoic acid acyltransferase DltB (MBOAT superfamily)